MKAPAKLGAFALALLVVFAGAWGIGRAAGPGAAATSPAGAPADGPATAPAGEHGASHETPAAGGNRAQPKVPGGLQIAQDGYRLELATPVLSTVDTRPFAFKVIGPNGEPVTAYTTAHERNLHLIVVRRDLTGFQHLHPTLGPDGLWSAPLKVAAPGTYRIFADFVPAGRAEGLILGTDINVPGDFQPRTEARGATGDYTATLEGELVPGTSSKLTLTVSKGGKPVTDLQPYLGAFGHLVALREGDLAYLHVHPDEPAAAGPRIVFHAEVPSAGAYRLYLEFQHEGTVRTILFATSTAGITVTAPSGQGQGQGQGHGH